MVGRDTGFTYNRCPGKLKEESQRMIGHLREKLEARSGWIDLASGLFGGRGGAVVFYA